MISNCGMPTGEASEFVDFHLKSIMQGEWSYIKSFNNISRNTILVTADGVGSYPSIAHEFGLNAIKEALHNRERKSILTEDILEMLEFVMKSNYFEFNGKIK